MESSAACGVARNKLTDFGCRESSRGVRANHRPIRKLSIRRKARGGIHGNYGFGMQRCSIVGNFVDVFNHQGEEAFHFAFQTRAEKSVHNHTRLSHLRTRRVPLSATCDFLNCDAGLFQPLKIFRSVSPNGIFLCEKINAWLQALLLKKPGNNEPVAAVVSLATKNSRATRGYVVVVG